MAKFKCRVCKAMIDHAVIPEFSRTLPPHLAVVECGGCGVLGVQMLKLQTDTASTNVDDVVDKEL